MNRIDTGSTITLNGKQVPYYCEIPNGFRMDDGATTAPFGFLWYTNGKSLIKRERISVLVKDKVA